MTWRVDLAWMIVLTAFDYGILNLVGASGSTTQSGQPAVKENPSQNDQEKKGSWLPTHLLWAVSALVGAALIATVSLTVVTRKWNRGDLKKRDEELAENRADHWSILDEMLKRSKFLEEQRRKPYQPQLDAARGPNALALDRVNTWSAHCDKNASSANVDPVSMRLQAHTYEAELVIHGLDTPADSRYKEIPTRKDSQVVVVVVQKSNRSSYRTPMNVTRDFYGNRILIGQAPMPNRIVEHLSALFQEEVGVQVWVGDLKDSSGKEKIFPYIPMAKGLSVSFQQFTMTTTDMALCESGCNTYKVDVEMTGEIKKKRQLTLIYVPHWPNDHTAAKPFELTKAIRRIAVEQQEQSSNGLPSIAVHCSNGAYESISLVAAYIGRQSLLHERTVDPIAILDRIRHDRYLALSTSVATPQQINSQLAVVASILHVVAMDLGKMDQDVGSSSSEVDLESQDAPFVVVKD